MGWGGVKSEGNETRGGEHSHPASRYIGSRTDVNPVDVIVEGDRQKGQLPDLDQRSSKTSKLASSRI